MDDNKMLTRIFSGMIILGIALLLYSQKSRFLPSQQSTEKKDGLSQAEKLRIRTPLKKSARPRSQGRQSSEERKIKAKVTVESFDDKMEEKARKIKVDFKSKVKAKIELPPELTFISIDLDDEGEAIYGYNNELGLGLTVMAVPRDVKFKEVLPYLDSSQSYLENTKNNPVVKIGKASTLPKPKGSTKLKDATLWSGKLKNGDDIHIVMLRRADNKGSYFYLYSGPNDYFSSNEDYFEGLLNNFEALPYKAN